MDPKRIVITGCTRGLGKALAEFMAGAGHIVIGCGRSERELEELRARLGNSHSFEPVDVSADAAVLAWANTTLAKFGPPDYLINNAAVINRNAPLWELDAEEFSRVIDINIKGTANVIRHFVPAMVARKHGVIVNFSSGWGRSTSPDVAPYCASKWAIEGLTQALSQELPRGMGAVALNPGIIDTEMLRSCFGGSSGYPDAGKWVNRAGPYILGLSARENGKSLSV